MTDSDRDYILTHLLEYERATMRMFHALEDMNCFPYHWVGIEDMISKSTELLDKCLCDRKDDNMKICLDAGAKMPERAHTLDAGYDVFSREDRIVEAHDSATFDIGVHVEIPEGYVGFLKSKSGLNVNHSLTSEGVIDAGYTGSIRVKLYNHSGYDYAVHAGDKISQLVLIPVFTPQLELVDALQDSDRGSNGFGSTGR